MCSEGGILTRGYAPSLRLEQSDSVLFSLLRFLPNKDRLFFFELLLQLLVLLLMSFKKCLPFFCHSVPLPGTSWLIGDSHFYKPLFEGRVEIEFPE